MGILGEGATLLGRQRPAKRGLDLPEVAPAEELPGEVPAEGGHDHATPTGHDGGSLLERDQMAGAAVAVGDEDVPEAGAGQRVPVVHHHVAHETLTHPDRAHGVEREAAEMEGRGKDHAPAGRVFTSSSASASEKWRAVKASTPTGRWGPCSSSGLTVRI